jgi:anaerobic magnesium-protoporphyrin IX monomethyl ester cyclase
MSEEVIEVLRQTGCFRVWIGAESGSQKIIDAMDRRVDVAVVREMIIKTKKAGIEAGTFIMLGYPGENKSDIKETINHLKKAAPTFYTITVAYPITGTPLYNEVDDSLVVENSWASRTDREYDFKRKYSKQFYLHAVNWVYNEVNYAKTHNLIKKAKFKARSVVAQAKMLLT